MRKRDEIAMEKDIDKHFGEKLNTMIYDTVDTCQIAGFHGRDTIKLIFTGLFYELIRCAAILKMDEEEFMGACRIAYRCIIKHASKSIE